MSGAATAGRRILVSGASRGIGRSVAEALLARGDRLAVLARDKGALEALLAQAAAPQPGTAGTPGHVALVGDLQHDDVEGLVDGAAQALGGLDGLVCAAGIVEYAEVGAISRPALERQLAVNLVAPMLMAQRASAHLERAGGGSIVLIGSTLSERPAPMTTAYASSKAGLAAAARSLALELGPRNVRVNVVEPGVIDTDMVRVVRARAGEPELSPPLREARIAEQLEALRSLHPRGRLGTTQDVAETVLYLLDAPYVTGTVVRVDGGLSLGTGEP